MTPPNVVNPHENSTEGRQEVGRARPHGHAQALDELILGLGACMLGEVGEVEAEASLPPCHLVQEVEAEASPSWTQTLTPPDLIGIGEACPFKPHPHPAQEELEAE